MIHDDILVCHLLFTFYYVAIREICCLYGGVIRDLLRFALKIRDSYICCGIWTASAGMIQSI